MRLLLSILVLLAVASPICATQQVPDVIEYDGEICELDVQWSYPSPLEVYFRISGKEYPFEMLSTGNYRGHIAAWKLESDILYLEGITTEESIVNLVEIFPDAKGQNRIKASWFDGIVWVKSGRHKTEYQDGMYHIEYSNWTFLRFIQGEVVKRVVLTNSEYREAARNYYGRRETDNPVKDGPIFELEEYINSFE